MSARTANHAAVGLALLVAAAAPSAAARAQASLPDVPAFRAARVIARGSILTAQDIEGGSTLEAGRAPLGWVARRLIHPGESLRTPAVAPRPVIRRGATVQADFVSPGIRITQTAVALADAAIGDTLMVRIDRRRNIPAVVRDSGTVTLLRR